MSLNKEILWYPTFPPYTPEGPYEFCLVVTISGPLQYPVEDNFGRKVTKRGTLLVYKPSIDPSSELTT